LYKELACTAIFANIAKLKTQKIYSFSISSQNEKIFFGKFLLEKTNILGLKDIDIYIELLSKDS